MRQRIVITGLGLVTPIGIGIEQFYSSLMAGKEGVDEIEYFDTSKMAYKMACEVKGFDISNYFSDKRLEAMGRSSQLAAAAAQMALGDSGLEPERLSGDEIGVTIGTGLGEIQLLEKIDKALISSENIDVSPLSREYIKSTISGNIASLFGLKGPNCLLTTACSAGNDAIIHAAMQLELSRASIMVAGGVDPLSRIAFTGFARLNSMEKEHCRPFDKERKGIIVGEGAAVVILEKLESALERGAPIYAELAGYATSCDAHHITMPDPSPTSGVVRAIRGALNSAGMAPGDVDYISAHGTGTLANDRVESGAIKEVFKDEAPRIPVSSIKSMTGHTGGAAGAMGVAASLLAIKNGVVPPTVNYKLADPDCPLDYVPSVKREQKVDVVLNNSFAFGGNNSCLVLSGYRKES